MFYFQCEHGEVFYYGYFDDLMVYDEENYLAHNIPKCRCEKPGRVRPNMMFPNDPYFNTKRSDEQQQHFQEILNEMKQKNECKKSETFEFP